MELTFQDDSNKRKRVVVFGGNGYVGSNVCQEVIRLDADVHSISRKGVQQVEITTV